MFGRKNLDLVLRMAPEEESGRYAIGEIALSTQLMTRICHSAGWRSADHMTTDVRVS